MRRTLIDEKLESKFQSEGYVELPFLSTEEVELLKKYYFDTLNESGGRLGPEDERYQSETEITYDFTFIDKNTEYKQKVFDMITSAFMGRVADYLDDYRPIIANFIRKMEDGGEVPLHQNWAFADEHRCATVSIWCPLVDSNRQNGTLELVPGSHKRFGEVRGPMIKSELLGIQQEIIEQFMQPIETKAGNAVILDDSIVHYSSPNQTDGLRLAIQLILIPKEEKSIHFHMDLAKDRTQVEVLEVDTDFYMKFNPWKKPSEDVKRVNSFKYVPFDLTIDEFGAKLRQPRFDEKINSSELAKGQSWWKKLRSKLVRA